MLGNKLKYLPDNSSRGYLVPTLAGCMCPKVKDMGQFQLQESEMSENISLQMGVNFAPSITMGRNFC